MKKFSTFYASFFWVDTLTLLYTQFLIKSRVIKMVA